jgi:ubiquinone/menaquinone biosynthesis C-methylase UbiE
MRKPENWLEFQINKIVKEEWSWTKAIAMHYPQYLKMWTDPDEHFNQIQNDWNYLNAVKYMNWDDLIEDYNLKVVDLGCGTGWLTAFLSTFQKVETVYAVDSDSGNIEIMLPEIVERMNGDTSKIVPVIGLFEPLNFEDKSIDIIAISSSIHHSPNISTVLSDINRVLKDNGKLIILNEIPMSKIRYLVLLLSYNLSILKSLLTSKILKKPKVISSNNGILYDPFLGDYVLPYFLWYQLFVNSGFEYKMIRTPYHPYQSTSKGGNLHHFICEKQELRKAQL